MIQIFSAREIYPNAAGHKTGGASQEAAHKINPKLKELQRLVLDTLGKCSFGATAEQLAALMGRSPLTIKPRLSELKALGLVRKTNRRATTELNGSCHIWEVV